MITRHALRDIDQAFKVNPVVGLLGPRQSGKTTLAQQYSERFSKDKVWFFDLENPRDLARLSEPALALAELDGLIILDEIQREPELFSYLRVLIDQKKRKTKILILGSASRDLIQQSSETLAGRISYVELHPLQLSEADNTSRLHLRGGFPLAYLAKSELGSYRWRQDYIATFLERDLIDFGYKIPPKTIRRFWMMLSHFHGQILNFSELARSFGISDMTVRKYLEILSETFMIRLLEPWHENIAKRQVKAPKLYFRDSGIFHALLSVSNKRELLTHPKLGSSWEGFALEQVIRLKRARAQECFFWSTHNQTELDLILFEGGKRIGYEFKYSDTPKLGPSMKIALEDLKLHELIVITPKGETYSPGKKVVFTSLENWASTFQRAK